MTASEWVCALSTGSAIAAKFERQKIASDVPAIMRLPACEGFAEPMLALVSAPAANP